MCQQFVYFTGLVWDRFVYFTGLVCLEGGGGVKVSMRPVMKTDEVYL